MANEKRLIDANALKDEILSWAVCINKPHLLSRDDTMYMIDNAPTVDAVEVVRCEDCKHFNDYFIRCDHPKGLPRINEKSFCSFGERKEN